MMSADSGVGATTAKSDRVIRAISTGSREIRHLSPSRSAVCTDSSPTGSGARSRPSISDTAMALSCGGSVPRTRSPSWNRSTVSSRSTAEPSASSGTVNAASSSAVRRRSSVVPIRRPASFSQASRRRAPRASVIGRSVPRRIRRPPTRGLRGRRSPRCHGRSRTRRLLPRPPAPILPCLGETGDGGASISWPTVEGAVTQKPSVGRAAHSTTAYRRT